MNPEQIYNEKCICQICNCGKHKCPKPHPKGDFTTSYGKDYVEHGQVEHRTPKKQQAYESKHYDPRDLVSHYQDHYVPKEGLQREMAAKLPKNFVLPEAGFQGESSYNGAYRGFSGNYKDLRAQIERRNSMLPKSSFVGQSTYTSNYIGAAMARPDKIIMKDSLELAKGQFDDSTTYNRNYTEKPNAKPDAAERPRSRKDLIRVNDNFNSNTSYTDTYIGAMGLPNAKFVPKGELSVGNHPFDANTAYNDSYVGAMGQPNMKMIPKGELTLGNHPFDANTAYNQSYVGARGVKNDKFVPKGQLTLGNHPFDANTAYNQSYIGAMGQPNSKFVPKGQLTLGNHPFDAQTNYNANYKGLRPEPRSPILPGSGIPVIPPGAFQGDSTYGAAYQAVRGARSEPYRPKETPLAQGAFKGQSTYTDHYIQSQMQKPVACPAVVLHAPTYNLLDQQHLKYNAKLNMWT